MPSFQESLLQKILDEDKTQTRRPVKEGEQLLTLDGLKTVLSYSGRIKYQVGRDYACTYGRAKPTARYGLSEAGENKLLVTWEEYQNWQHHPDFDEKYKPIRYRLLDIWKEDVREISYEDSVAEGFATAWHFYETWCQFYDEKTWSDIPALRHHSDFKVLLQVLNDRPDHLYQAWAYTFELVGAQSDE